MHRFLRLKQVVRIVTTVIQKVRSVSDYKKTMFKLKQSPEYRRQSDTKLQCLIQRTL
jgi:hypothetical protein